MASTLADSPYHGCNGWQPGEARSRNVHKRNNDIPYLKNSDGWYSSQFVFTCIHPVMHVSKGVCQTFSSDLRLLYEARVEHVSSLHSLPVHLHAHPFHQCIPVHTHTTTLYNPIYSLGVVLVTGIAREPAGCRTLSRH